MAHCRVDQRAILQAVNEARRLLAERQTAEVRKWTDQVGDNSVDAVTGGESPGAVGRDASGDTQLETSCSLTSDSSEEEWGLQQSDISSGSKRIISLSDVFAPCALDLLQPARQAAGDAVAGGADCTSKPRKMHSLRLSELRWDALANRREQRRTLHLRGLPAKLCGVGALEVLLKAEGLWETVADLRILPRKASQPGCAVLSAKDSLDVQRLAKYFHGRQFGAGAPVAVSFAAPGFVNSLRPGHNPAKVQSSLDPVGVASFPLAGVEASMGPSVPVMGDAGWQPHRFGLAARSPPADILGVYPWIYPMGNSTETAEDSSVATTMNDLALDVSRSASRSSSGCGSGDESEVQDREVLVAPPPGLEAFAPPSAC